MKTFIMNLKIGKTLFKKGEVMEKLVLIDGNSLVNRAFYALPPLNNSLGVPTQAVYGFATMLMKIISDIKPNYMAVAFDLPKPTFRHLKYPEYKAGRHKMPDELGVQLPILKEMLKLMNIHIIEKGGFEADDIIGTFAKSTCVHTYIITGDRDSLQLIDDNTEVWLTIKGLSEIHKMTEEELLKSLSLKPSQIIDYKALAGDSSDNIPGVAGVGEKTATNLLVQYGTLDKIYENIDNIKGKLQEKLINDKDNAYLSYELATIDTNMELDCNLKDCTFDFPFNDKVQEFFGEMNFKSLVNRAELFIGDVKPKFLKAGSEVKVVSSIEELRVILGQVKGSMSFDIAESITFAFSEAQEYVINLNYSLIDVGLEYNQCIESFKEVLQNPKIEKIVFDGKKLMKELSMNKVVLNNFFDIKLAQYLIDMTVDYSTAKKLNAHYGVDEREIASGMRFIKQLQENEIEELKMKSLYYDIELPLEKVLYDMERAGFCLNIPMLNVLNEEYVKEIESLTKEIYALCGETFNINSPKQLAKVLFEDMKIPYPKKSKTYSTAAEILEEIDEPIVALILEYRFISKLNSTYIEGLRKMADAKGIVHTEFKQTLTTTGRLSSVEPNLQNIPIRNEKGKKLRAMFASRGENYRLVSADYSQIELRLMAHYSKDEKMLSAYRNGEDIHTSTAAAVFNVQSDKVTAAMRRDAKAVNFGIIYGISEYGLSKNLKISPYRAKEFIETYFSRFSGVKSYLETSVKSAYDTGYAVTLLGRVRKIPELKSANYNIRQFGERVAMNMPLQGSAADIIKFAMIKVAKELEGMKSQLILQVHDELIVDAEISEIEKVKEILKRCMENVLPLEVPLTVEMGEGKTWLEC